MLILNTTILKHFWTHSTTLSGYVQVGHVWAGNEFVKLIGNLHGLLHVKKKLASRFKTEQNKNNYTFRMLKQAQLKKKIKQPAIQFPNHQRHCSVRTVSLDLWSFNDRMRPTTYETSFCHVIKPFEEAYLADRCENKISMSKRLASI